MCGVAFRCERGDFFKITILGRSNPGCSDYWDGNWIHAEIEVSAGGFRGAASGELRTEELAAFASQLSSLQESLRGEAVFETMEDWLSIRVTGDGLGHMELNFVVRDQPGIGNRLDCTLATDQTFTRSTAAELAAIVQAFPVVGNPNA